MRLWMVVLLAGCWGTTPPPQAAEPPPQDPTNTTTAWRSKPRGPSRCEGTIDHVVAIMKPQLDSMYRNRIDALRDAAVASCIETRWGDEGLSCYEGATDIETVEPCFKLLSSEQRADFENRIATVLKQSTP